MFGASEAALAQATTYLRISALGIPAMLVVLATTGVLRGLQDTRTPLFAAVGGFGLEHRAQPVVRARAALGHRRVGLGHRHRPDRHGRRRSASSSSGMPPARPCRCAPTRRGCSPRPAVGIPLFVRTLALRGVLLVTTWVAAGLGDVPLAAYQVTATIWTFLAFALDALAIAAQAITGKALGAGEVDRTRDATTLVRALGHRRRCRARGARASSLRPWLGPLFTPDPAVQAAIAGGLVVVALGQPLSGFVFVVDGVLIGAGDGPWLARAMLATLAAYLPVILAVNAAGDWLLEGGSTPGRSTPSSGCGSPSPPSCRCAAP